MAQLKKSDILKKGDFQVKHPFSVSICCVAFLIAAASLHAQALAGADISIRFFNRTVYYPGNSPTEPVLVQVTINNASPATVRFKLADDHFFSLDFSAVNTRNQTLEHTEDWIKRRTSNRQVFFREMAIESGESFSFTENVKDYVKIENPGMYVISCSIYPELKYANDDSDASIKSNSLTLEVKPSPGAASVRVMPVSPVTSEILQPQPIPPDQVITYILTARQKSQWEKFFLYLDIEQMISRDPAKKRRYIAESENGRFTMQENYKSELMQEKSDKDKAIATIPVEFRIERTSYTDTDGTVSVLEWFDYKTFREKKRYTYSLTSRNGIWRVIDYTVDNLGTE
jgi:hypothetical protein